MGPSEFIQQIHAIERQARRLRHHMLKEGVGAEDDALSDQVAKLLQFIDVIRESPFNSQRDETERALHEHRARLQAIVDTAVDGIVTIDEHGTIESFNPAAERMFQYASNEVIGQNIKMLMPNPYRAEHDGYIARYLSTGEKRIIGIGREVIGKRKDGTVFPVDLAVSELRLGPHRLFTGLLRDITYRKTLEKEVLRASTFEQRRIGRDLHDGLGQELTGIAFLAGVLVKKLQARSLHEADDAAEIVAFVNNAIDHTRDLVQGLCPVDLEAEGLMRALRALADSIERRYDVKCEFQCPTPVLVNDPAGATHLYYIANEAVHNAVRHGKPSRIVIELLRKNEQVTLAVTDDGVGITTEKAALSGNGLNIMRYRCGMLGGHLQVRSARTNNADDAQTSGTSVTCSFDISRLHST